MSPILVPNSCVEIGTFFPRSLTRPGPGRARHSREFTNISLYCQHF
ncbi:hypothetical protein HMPREF1138_0446 [Actinomyces sp. ICM58]|nr:hypothetical protein HMPREF1138_0446 [Actinomyces sp. ICM58]